MVYAYVVDPIHRPSKFLRLSRWPGCTRLVSIGVGLPERALGRFPVPPICELAKARIVSAPEPYRLPPPVYRSPLSSLTFNYLRTCGSGSCCPFSCRFCTCTSTRLPFRVLSCNSLSSHLSPVIPSILLSLTSPQSNTRIAT